METTAAKKGTMGDMMDYSKELSMKRAAKNGGVDPVKEKYYKKYSDARNGTKHPQEIKDKGYESKNVKIEYD